MSTDKWSGQGWTITVTGTEMALAHASGSVAFSSTDAARLTVRRRWFRWVLDNEGQPLVRLRGITKTEAAALSGALRRLALTPAIADAVAWYAGAAQLLTGARIEQRWISTETVDALVAFTVSVAIVLVWLPAALLTITSNFAPLSPETVAGVV